MENKIITILLNKLKTTDPTFIIGQLFFIVYFSMALLFYKERTMSFEGSFFSFEIIRTNTFYFPLHRFGCGITQALPLLLLKMTACSLKTFLISYSISLALFYYLIFLVIAQVLKDYKVVFVYLLTLCLTYRNTFYFGVSEFSQGLALTVLLYALLRQIIKHKESKKQILFFIVSILLIFFQYYFHPLTIIAILFVLFLTIIREQLFFDKYFLFLVGFSIVWFGYNMVLKSKVGGYETERMNGFKDFFVSTPSLLNLPSFKYLIKFITGTPLISFGIISVGIIISLIKRKFLLAVLFFFYPSTYIFFIIIAYYKGEAPNMYEQYYIYFGFFAALIFSTFNNNQKNVKYLVLAVSLLVINIYSMYNAHIIPTKKLSFITNLTNRGLLHEYKKYLITIEDYPYQIAWSTWAFPLECLLMSSLNNDGNCVAFYVPTNDEEIRFNRKKGKFYFFSPDYDLNTRDLNKRFFSLPEETNYITLKSP